MILSKISKSASYFSNIFCRSWFHKDRLILLRRSMATLETLNFDNKASNNLPLDQDDENNVRTVRGACYSRVKPTAVENPQLVAVSKPALELLDLSDSEINRNEFVEYFSGNKLLPGSNPVAHCYCGHQFGYFAGQLGDGAAITLGEIVNKSNERWEVQLKGAGKTPYSRTADGRKVLRSSIREFLCSEAMHFLGIPTTRAGCIITSDTRVVRDIFYNGNPILEKCSIVCRIAPTFVRFGSFQICKGPDRETGNSGPSASQPDVVKSLLDFVIETYYEDIWREHNQDKEKMYSEFFGEVVKRTAHLVAQWQCVGWCHGVLNTDNMSILGLTIDYGPFGFLDHYDPNHICNASDDGGRYTYKNQPEMCKWNCEKLAEILQIFTSMMDMKLHLDGFDEEFKNKYLEIMRKKFGLLTEQDSDEDLIDGFLDAMEKTGADFTNSFRCLSLLSMPGCEDGLEGSAASSSSPSSGESVLNEVLVVQCATAEEMKIYCKPRIGPRHLSALMEFMALLESDPGLGMMIGGKQQQQIAIELKRMKQHTYWSELPADEKKNIDSKVWSEWIATYVKRLKLDADQLTKDVARDERLNVLNELNKKRIAIMKSSNPRFILRNHIAQEAIEAAEAGDYSKVQNVLKRLETPFDDVEDFNVSVKTEMSHERVAAKSCHLLERPPGWASKIKVS